ncbi:MAG: helix-turn-helix transcriptional regulator [Clostridiales bacterium]|nr:helix-turn-helix transcriptional regulator [Clostridiales bacterium]
MDNHQHPDSPEQEQRELDSKLVEQFIKDGHFPEDDLYMFLDATIEEFFEDLLTQAGMKKSEVIREANISRRYGYQILNGTRTAHRDYYLRIALVLKLDLRTTQRMLALAQVGSLHPLIKRDAAIIYTINQGYDNYEAYDFMVALGLTPLEKDE